MDQLTAPITSIKEIIPGIFLLWLQAPRIASQAQPGQFVMVRCGEDNLLRRPLSIHRVDGSRIALLFAVVGRGTEWLSQCQAGDTVDLLGPLGNGYEIHQDAHNLLLVAGGIGIAPLRFLVDRAVKEEKEVTLLMGAQTYGQLYPESLLPLGIRLAQTTEDGSFGEKGMVTDLLPGYSIQADQVFACGPVAMHQVMSQMPELKNRPVQVSLEVRMGCGRGLCYGCTLKTCSGLQQVCTDGPVFNLDDVLWNELTC